MIAKGVIELAELAQKQGDPLLAKALFFVAGAKMAKDEYFAAELLNEAGEKMKARIENLEQSANAKLN
jgi:hypothetical protein